ncbi:hypothetical protein TNCV_4809121 [Trichonephila clavipes]|nr:hypothetical protein TNCV_4809121 [Trichonephila clavipes]
MSSLDCSARHACYSASTHQSHFSLVIGSNTHDWLQMAPPTYCLKVQNKTRLNSSHQCMMDQIDAFPEHISTTVVPVTQPEKPDAFGICSSAGTSPCLHHLPGT